MGKIIDVRAPAAWAATTTTATFAGEGLQLAQSIGWRCDANDTPKWGFVNYGGWHLFVCGRMEETTFFVGDFARRAKSPTGKEKYLAATGGLTKR